MACDPFWNKTVLAIPMDGAAMSDLKGATVTKVGNAAFSTAIADPWGGATGCLALDGTDDRLSVPSGTAYDIRDGEFFVRGRSVGPEEDPDPVRVTGEVTK